MDLSDKLPQKKGRIEIIPLIDCMFLLLVFFVYSMMTLTLPHGISVNLPRAATAPAIQQEALTISITDADEVFLNKEMVDLETLAARIEAAHSADPSLRVFINGDTDARHGVVVKVLDILRTQSVDHVAIQTVPFDPQVQ